MHTNSGDRLERERQFHDNRFTHETRTGQDRFYDALSEGFRRYWELVHRESCGKDVLEYGCATGVHSVRLAGSARSIVGIDISPVAIQEANREAAARSIGNARFETMNAEAMDLPPESFDLVFGSAILHHLDLARAFAELQRVMRPHATGIFLEPLGHNPLINLYRRATPQVRTVDEHPLRRADLKLARKHFGRVSVEFFALAQLGGAVCEGTPLARITTPLTRALDSVLQRLPGVRWHCWSAIFVLER